MLGQVTFNKRPLMTSQYLCEFVEFSQPGSKHFIQVLVFFITVLLLLFLPDVYLLI